MSYFKYGHLVETTATIATAGGTTTLLNNSAPVQEFTGSANQTVVFPNATTMVKGQSFSIVNRSSGVLTINYNGGTNIGYIQQGETFVYKLTDNSTAAGLWTLSQNHVGDQFFDLHNLSITASAGSNQITIGLRDANGNNFSTTSYGILAFRNSTATNGTLLKTVLTANPTDFVVSAGASLGLRAGVAGNYYFYIYARYENATSVTLGVCSHSLEEGDSITSVAMSASADTLKTLYAADATTKRIRCLGTIRATKDASDNWTAILLIQPAPQGNQIRQVSLIDASTEAGFEFKELSATPNRPFSGYKKLYVESQTGFTDKSLQLLDSGTDQYPVIDQKHLLSIEGLHNLSINYSTASGGAFTITLNGSQNIALGTSNHGFIMFRDNNGATSGRTYPCYLSGNLTVTLDSGATLGLPSATTSRIYVYAIYQSSSSAVLAVSPLLMSDHFTKGSTTLDSSADNADILYSDTGVSTNSVRLLGYIEALHTTGSWSTPTKAYCGINPSIQVLNQTYPQNYIDNPEFIISQRGDFETSPINPVTGNYYVDRWKVDSNAGNGNYTLQISSALADLPILPMSKQTQIMKLTLTGSNFSGYMTVYQPLDYTSRFQQKVTWLSCWVKSNNANARIMMYDGTNYLGAASNNHSGGGNWEYLSCPILATGGNLKAYVGIIGSSSGAPNVTINTGHYIYFTAMKYEVGPNPTPFVARTPFSEEFIRCKMHFLALQFVAGNGTSSLGPFFYSNSSTVVYHTEGSWFFRATPTLSLNAGTTYKVINSAGTDVTAQVTSWDAPYGSANVLGFRLQSAAAFTNTVHYRVLFTGTPNIIYLSAEL